jgi:hypothetical protein
MRHPATRTLLLTLLLALTACRDPKVEVYQIPKEPDAPPAQVAAEPPHPGMAGAGDMANTAVATAEGPSLVWTAPAHWRPKTGSTMRKGSYAIGPETGPAADLAITAFPGNVGGDLANVNRWRAQLQVPPITDAELAGVLMPMEANGLKILVTDILGGTADGPQRMLGAIVPFNGATWFFKLVGPDALVAAEKSSYLAMLQTVKASTSAPADAAQPVAAPTAPAAATMPPPAADMAGTAVRTASGPGLKWSAPAHWQNIPASGMRTGTFRATGADGATAELAITAFPGDVGGELANVNRWRGQLQLPPITAAELPAAITRLSAHGLNIAVVEFTGGTAAAPQRLLGASVPVDGATWFFKFTGPPALIEQEKPAFLAFIQTLQTP